MSRTKWLVLGGAGAVLVAVLVIAVWPGGGSDEAEAGAAPAATIGSLQILNPIARPTINDVTAAYLTIQNTGSETDSLLAVSSSISPSVMLHTTETTGSTSSMKQLELLEIPAHGSVTMNEGATHLMLNGLTAPLKAGDTIDLQLIFAKAGSVRLQIPVKDYTEPAVASTTAR
jgi:copper(I)-binding protein